MRSLNASPHIFNGFLTQDTSASVNMATLVGQRGLGNVAEVLPTEAARCFG